MARRKQSTAGDVIELTSRVPWWVGVVLASLSFVALHLVGGADIAQPDDVRGMGNAAATQYLKTIASILQWLLPALFLAGAAISARVQRRRASLHDNAAVGTRRALAQMSWQEVEDLVGEYFRRREFSVTDTERAGPDEGIDLVLTKRDEYYLARCKRWRAVTVGVKTVRELCGVMAARHAAGGFVVTSGSFSAEAKKFVEGREIELINGEQLAAAIATQAKHAAPLEARGRP
jgi:restriction system protein